jgi:hypothetical protein
MNNILVGNYKKVFLAILAAVLIVSSFFVAGSALASATINSAKLNGLNNLTVEGSALITVTVDVSLTDQSVWKSTAYRFGDGSWTCVNTPDHTTGNTTATETFPITAPAKIGTSNVNFEVYGNNDCTTISLDVTVAPANLLTAVRNVLSFGTDKMWLLVISFLLIIAIVVFTIFYFVKRGNKEKI